MPLFDLLAELRERGSVRLRFRLWGCNAGFPIGDPSSSAIAVIDRDHPLDAVQLNGGGEIVPKRLVPVLERRRDHADRRTCLNFPVRFCSTVYRCTGSCMRG